MTGRVKNIPSLITRYINKNIMERMIDPHACMMRAWEWLNEKWTHLILIFIMIMLRWLPLPYIAFAKTNQAQIWKGNHITDSSTCVCVIFLAVLYIYIKSRWGYDMLHCALFKHGQAVSWSRNNYIHSAGIWRSVLLYEILKWVSLNGMPHDSPCLYHVKHGLYKQVRYYHIF